MPLLPYELRKFLLIGLSIVVLVAVVGSVVVVGRSILSSASTTVASPSATPQMLPFRQPATPSAFPSITPIATDAGQTSIPTSTTGGWSVTGSGDVTVVPNFGTNNKSLDVDFQSQNFSKIPSISYTLSYTADPAVSRVIKGTVTPASESVFNQGTISPYIRKTIALGTCSGANCVYDTNSRSFNLKVIVKTNGGLKAYLITLTRANLPDLGLEF